MQYNTYTMVDGKPTIAIKGPFYDVKIMIMITVVAQTKSIKACPHHACTHTHTHTHTHYLRLVGLVAALFLLFLREFLSEFFLCCSRASLACCSSVSNSTILLLASSRSFSTEAALSSTLCVSSSCSLQGGGGGGGYNHINTQLYKQANHVS